MPVDPAIQFFLDAVAARSAEAGPPADPLAAARAGVHAMFGSQSAPEVPFVERAVPGPVGDIPIRVYDTGTPGPKPVFVFFHGGGFISGSPASHDASTRRLAVAADCVVVSVDYRLAPEHPFPAGVEDCQAVLEWVAAHAASIGGDPSRLAIGGDSAGGNLAAVVAVMNRDRGGPAVALQALVYPVIDPACDSATMVANAEGFMLTSASMRWMWSMYATPEQQQSPYANPMRSPSLAGLPPAVVITAEYDPLCAEGETYAAALTAAGVPTTLRRFDGMIHGFFSLYDLTPAAAESVEVVAGALRTAWGR